jgi:hypothetical protein
MEWPEPMQRSQSLYVVVKRWDCRVIPSLYGPDFGTCEFDFEARCVTSPFKDLEVHGSVEVVTPGDYSGKIPYRWTSVPDVLEGCGFLTDCGETRPPLLGFTLFCKHSTLEWIYRIFLAAFTISNSNFGISITIEPPDQLVEDFWHEAWKTEWWVVVTWRLVMDVERSDP